MHLGFGDVMVRGPGLGLNWKMDRRIREALLPGHG